MSKHKLKMEIERIEMTPYELDGVFTPLEFNTEHFSSSSNKEETLNVLDGTHLWLAGVTMNNDNEIHRDQPPVEVILVNDRDMLSFHHMSDTDTAGEKIKLIDGLGNGLHMCQTRLQAQYMYNKDLMKIVNDMTDKINKFKKVRKQLISLEQYLDPEI